MKQNQNNSLASRAAIRTGALVLAIMLCLGGGLFLRNAQTSADANTTGAQLTFASTEQDTAQVPSFAQSGQYTRAQIVEKCAPSVVGIDITCTTSASDYYSYGYGYGFGFGFGNGNDFGGNQQQEVKASGSGVVLTADGYIATCAHVVDSATSITVTFNDDKSYPATLVGSDENNDIAIIKIEASDLVPATVGNSDSLVVGEDVIAIGNSMGKFRGTATSGIISATKRTITVEGQEMELLQTDAAVNSGNSGGGLFNANGELIGIVNAKISSSGVEGIGFAIPVNNITKEISDILSYGYVTGRAYLGVYTQNVTVGQGYSGRYYSGGKRYVQIVEVVQGSAAEAAGLQAGDYILKVNDTEVSTNTALSDIIQDFYAGDKATLTIMRGNKESTVEVTFGEYVPEQPVQEQ